MLGQLRRSGAARSAHACGVGLRGWALCRGSRQRLEPPKLALDLESTPGGTLPERGQSWRSGL